MGTGEFNSGGNPAMDLHPIQGEEEILLVASKLLPYEPLGSCEKFNQLLTLKYLPFGRT